MLLLGKLISSIKQYNKTTADLDPFGGRYTPQEKRDRAASQKSFHERMMRSNGKEDRRNRAPAGPTPEQQVASARAAEREAKIKKGKARRKKYEAAQTMAKKMKLIFVD